jgi:hypothetical protein
MLTLVAVAAFIAGLWSLIAPISIVAHAEILIVCAIPVRIWYVLHKPYVRCSHCDGGRVWNASHTRYSKGCTGGLLGRGSCHGEGERLHLDLRILRMLGIGRQIHDPVKTKKDGA